MLVLSRKSTESVVIDRDIRITVLKIRRHCVSLGIEAPERKRVCRNELLEVTRPDPDGDAPEPPVEPTEGTPPGADRPRDDQTPMP